jgi:DNA repair protein RadC
MRESRDFAFIMQVYEASIQYSLVRIGHDEAFNSPSQIVEYMNGAFDDAPLQESFYVVCLNRKNRPLCRTRITIGTATSALAHPREIFRAAVLASACAIVCVHNHPSGDPAPSSADLTVTRQIRDAGQLMGIDLLDHVIIGTKEDDPTGRGYYSFSGAGII